MKLYIKLFLLLSLFLGNTHVFSAGELDSFEVTLSQENGKVGEALDITISAVDENSEIITNYTWDILVFSETDIEAEFPNDLAENSYSFTSANEWTVKFENAVKFKNAGVQSLHVFALLDDTKLWVAEVTISEEEIETNVAIEILSPENGVTLWKNNITISGTTKKNHQVRILVNDSQDLFTTSNEDGIFEKDVEWLLEWVNTISAVVLNADSEKIWESKKIEVKISASAPEFKSIIITPSGDIESEAEIQIEVISNIWLSQVRAIINDIITELDESKDGVYKWKTNAPKEPGMYDVDVILRDEFALETIERWVETLKIVAIPELESGSEEIEETTIEEIEVKAASEPTDLDLTITGIEVTELKTKSIITWSALDDAESYNIYKKISDTQIELIDTITEPRYEIEITGDEIKYEDFAIKALWKTSSGELMRWDLSEMTKVKTGPEMYIIFALIAILLTSGIFFMRKTTA